MATMDEPRCHTLHWPTALLWLAGMLAVSYPLGWLAARIEQVYAPLILFPLLLGLVVAIAACALSMASNTGYRPLVLTGVALAGLATAGWLHWHSFQQATAQAQASYDEKVGKFVGQLSEMGALPAPPTRDFVTYLGEQAAAGRTIGFFVKLHGGWVWALWGVEALLVVWVALFVTDRFLRHPYCDGCRSWYRPIRQGPFPREMIKLAPPVMEDVVSSNVPLYSHLLACQTGCGPTGLQLSWNRAKSAAGVVPAGFCTVWLTADERRELQAALDAAAEASLSAPGDS